MLLALIAGAAPNGGRVPALSYIFAFLVAFLLLHLFGTNLSATLTRHAGAASLALALILAFEGIYLAGVESLWSRLRRRATLEQPATDWLAGLLLGLGSAFALPTLGGSAGLARAASLGDAGDVAGAFVLTALVGVGVVVVLLVVGHVANLILGRVAPGPWLRRAAALAMLLVAVALAAGWVG
jgi:amino acid transporter